MNVAALIPRRRAGVATRPSVRSAPSCASPTKPLRWAPKAAPIALDVSIDGDVASTFSAADLERFDRVEQVGDFHCVTTWTYRDVRWGGVRLRNVVRAAVGDELPPYLVASGADGPSAIFVTADVDGDDVLLATELDGEPLGSRHGAPLRLISLGQYGYKNVKHLIGLDFRHAEPQSTLGPKEHLRARVAFEERHSTLPNWAVRLPYRLLIVPTALAAERGLRRTPRDRLV